ncbi:ComEA family DNA-binding protein [Litoribrevibacter albus]|uniref:Helix-hairpin-helix domain-containing protein n=1 Tax=Litoribrevibacter albus TaxID=1473156 RepID=A0AA37S8F8_9GAMM|nr:ComEA family DNA-binding protein [Litoribrevibacter albus]GLQ30124.1 hypothetical protein GCM10007876_06020 [Litoribrevibacter albus]
MRLIITIAALVLTVSVWASEVININSATQKELEALKGIGPVIAERIVQYRESHGRFSTIDELDQVKGISATWIEKSKDKLLLSE